MRARFHPASRSSAVSDAKATGCAILWRGVSRLATGLREEAGEDEEEQMLDSVRKHVAIPYVPGKVLLSAATVASFGWLLAHDMIHPLVIYALQLYLSF